MTTIGIVQAVDADGVYVVAPGARGVVRGPLETLATVVAGDRVLIVDTGAGEPVVAGRLTADGTHVPEWNDLRVSLSTGRPNTSPPTFGTFRSGVQAWSFSASQTEQLYFETQMPHGWVVGSTIRPHIHWSPGNSTNTGSVVWQLEYSWGNVNGTFPATSTLSVTQAASGTPYAHQLAPFGDVAGTGKTESSVFVCRLARVGGDGADTFTAAAFGISVDFHFQAERFGSLNEIPEV